jgi:aerobic carbon-monoxide dehydrogenase large subunit
MAVLTMREVQPGEIPVIDALYETHGVDHIDMPCSPARGWAAMQGRAEPPQ